MDVPYGYDAVGCEGLTSDEEGGVGAPIERENWSHDCRRYGG